MKHNRLNNFIWLLSILITGLSCRKHEVKSSCDHSSSSFQAIFQNMTLNEYMDEAFFDTEIHEYSFVLMEDKEVCEIGYQSQPEISSALYLIEIIDSITGTIIYAGNHNFSSSETSFVTPTSMIDLQSGVTYTLKRTILLDNANGQFINLIGRVARKGEMSFPYTEGTMTITSTNFYQATPSGGGVLLNYAVPYIDLIFTE
jgi:hypothetical protein